MVGDPAGVHDLALMPVLRSAARLQELVPDAVLDAVESQDGWVTNCVAPGKIIIGELGGIETGIRQLIRRIPLETVRIVLPSGESITAPTPEETLRVTAFLILRRNQTRDYLDVAALADRMGIEHAAVTLSSIDEYYADQHEAGDGVASQLVRQLAEPAPKDRSTTRNLRQYKNLAARWQEWNEVVSVCRRLATAMVEDPQ